MNRHFTHWHDARQGHVPRRWISAAWQPALASMLLLGLAMAGVTIAGWIFPI